MSDLKTTFEYYAGNDAERKFDNQIRNTVYNEGNKVDMALYLQNQAILNMLRQQRDKPKKGYVIDTGYMGLVDGEYKLFATEGDYLDFIGGNKDE